MQPILTFSACLEFKQWFSDRQVQRAIQRQTTQGALSDVSIHPIVGR